MILTYQPARCGDRLLEAGVAYPAGAVIRVSDERGRQLLDAHAEVAEQRSGATRADLNRQAADVGVPDPHKLASKQAVIDAITAAVTPSSTD